VSRLGRGTRILRLIMGARVTGKISQLSLLACE